MMSYRSSLYALVALLAASTNVSHGFTTVGGPRGVVSKAQSNNNRVGNTLPTSTSTSSSTSLGPQNKGTGWDNFCIESMDGSASRDISPEEARRYRRTVYTHDDWVKHRQQDRFFIYLGSLFDSGVFQNSKREVFLCTSIALAVCVYNAVAGGYTDLFGGQHGPIIPGLEVVGIPMTAFTITSASLGLLLTFRANTSYKRWDEARKNWGMNINHTRDLVRMANTYYDSTNVTPEQRQDDLDHVALCTWAFVRAMKRHLSPEEEDEQAFRLELYEKLPETQAAMIIQAAHRPNRALQDLSFAIDDLPMHFARKNEVHAAATIFEDNLGSSERLLTSPVPLFYSRHTARYISVWLFLLPFGFYDVFKSSWNHVMMIPATFVLSLFLFGIEELATQLEEPFTILPMQAFCDKIYNWCTEIMSWSPGDNGRMPKPVLPQHKFFVAAAPAGAMSLPPRPEARPAVAAVAAQAAAAEPVVAPPPPAAAPVQAAAAPAKTAPPANGGGVAPPSGNMTMEDFLKQQRG